MSLRCCSNPCLEATTEALRSFSPALTRMDRLLLESFGNMVASSSLRNPIVQNIPECRQRPSTLASLTMFCRPRRSQAELQRSPANSVVFLDRPRGSERIAVNRANIATFHPEATAQRKKLHAIFRKAGSDVAALALLQIFCFLILAYLEPRFVLIHFYQLIPYVAIVLLIAQDQQRWAYMIGPLVSLGWLGLAYWAGLLYWAVEQLRGWTRFTQPQRWLHCLPSSPHSLP